MDFGEQSCTQKGSRKRGRKKKFYFSSLKFLKKTSSKAAGACYKARSSHSSRRDLQKRDFSRRHACSVCRIRSMFRNNEEVSGVYI